MGRKHPDSKEKGTGPNYPALRQSCTPSSSLKLSSSLLPLRSPFTCTGSSLGSNHGPSCGTHAPQPTPFSAPEREGQQPISATTNAPAPAAPRAGGGCRHCRPALGNTAMEPAPGWVAEQHRGGKPLEDVPRGSPHASCRGAGCPARVHGAEAIRACQGGAGRPGSLPQPVPCPCCAEPCVDVSVLAIKILNKEELSSL